MTARLPLTLGSSDAKGDDVSHWQTWAKANFQTYADIMGPVDGYYGNSDAAFTNEMQRRLGLPQTGTFDETTAGRAGYATSPRGGSPQQRKIWIYTAPGSGADWNVGPSYDLGERCRVDLKMNHQPVGFPKGGYLGIMGGDPRYSYIEVITAEKLELAKLIRTCPDRDDPAFEIWLSGYSQSMDGMRRAAAELFGEGGEFENLRSRINGIVGFGDPSRAPGPVKMGFNPIDTRYNPPGWGISRWQAPSWLNAITWSITTHGDMYACTEDNGLLPLFYEWFVNAETELGFVGYCAAVIIPAVASYLGPAGTLLGLGPAIAGLTGVGLDFVGTLITAANTNAKGRPSQELIDAFKAQHLLNPQGIAKVYNTLRALPGIDTHGRYGEPRPEFGNRNGIQLAYDTIAAFRR